MKKTLLTLLVLGVVGGTGFAYYSYHKGGIAPTVNTAAVTRGDIVDTVGATGTLQAVTTVQVGAQVSGIIQDLYADFNSLVKKGQVLARLDPSTIQTQIDQSKANLIRSQADLERLKVGLDDANQKLTRAQELSARNLIPQTDLETAQVNVRLADSQVKSQLAAITQAEASLKQNQVNLEHTVIEAPIDGLVISRNVDKGQTVAASLQAPTLFVLAADLTKMQVVANLDESDVGRIRPGQHVTFRVDAYPADDFTGTVAQVRLQPIVQQNVVTYATVIDVPNTELKLKPGMTANVNVEIARRSNVLRVPNAALRFRPTNEIYAALGQTPPADTGLVRGGGGGQGGGRGGRQGGDRGAGQSSPAATTESQRPTARDNQPPAAVTSQPSASSTARNRQTDDEASGETGAEASGPVPSTARSGRGGRGSNGGEAGNGGTSGRGSFRNGGNANGGGSLAERLQNMTPEERDRFLQRARGRGFDPSAGNSANASSVNAQGNRGAGRRGSPAESSARTPEGQTASLSAKNPAATTIDALFGPLPTVEAPGRVWLYVAKQLKPVRVRTGISDGQASELIEGDGLEEGTEVVTNVITGNETRPAATAGGFPGFGQPQRGGFPGGNNRGGGGAGGRGR